MARKLIETLVTPRSPQPVGSQSPARRSGMFGRKRKLATILHNGKAPASTTVISKLDDRFQQFVAQHIDPLFGNDRNKHFSDLMALGLNSEVTPYEKVINRNIALSLVGVGISTTSILFFPPLILATIPMAVFLTITPVTHTFRDIVHDKKITFRLLGSLNIIGTWLGGYFFIGSLAFLIYFSAEKLVLITQQRSHANLITIFGQLPRTVWVLVDGVEVQIPFEKLQVGDKLVLQAGETIAADGVIVAGMGTIDQHALTGESQPVEKVAGDTVYASTVVLTGKIEVEVQRAGQSTIAAEIVDIINTTAGYHTSIESRADYVTNAWTIPTLVAGGLAWPLVGYQQAVAIMGASIGLNMRITSPIAMLNFLNTTARNNILIKDGRSLELLKNIDTVVFDKTGTLTLEQPQVYKLHVLEGVTEDMLLTYAAAAEHKQTHPIALAILDAAAIRGLDLPNVQEAAYELGLGLRVQVGEATVYLGSQRFIQAENIAIPDTILAVQTSCNEVGHSLVYVAIDGYLAGAIELQSTIRPEAIAVIDNLHARGLSLYIISGDHEGPTRQLANSLGIENYFANTLPEDKAKLVTQLQHEGRSVCFVGDGINDSIALKKANVSVSLNGATKVAMDTAQILLMDETLEQLPSLFDVADALHDNMEAEFLIATVPGFVIVGGAYLFNLGILGALMIWNVSLVAGLALALNPSWKISGQLADVTRRLQLDKLLGAGDTAADQPADEHTAQPLKSG